MRVAPGRGSSSLNEAVAWVPGRSSVAYASGRRAQRLRSNADPAMNRSRSDSSGVAFVSLAEGIDATTPAGKLQMHILGAIAEFERERIRERVLAGLGRVRAAGRRLGRPRTIVADQEIERTSHLSVREAAAALGVSRSVLSRVRVAQSARVTEHAR
jgi:DNA invertase Pin-like site-specific DNA recombinase